MRTTRTIGRAAAGLTATQIILLKHAKAGSIRMLRGDRKGTRCVGYEAATGIARMVAYSSPEQSLLRRGLLSRGAERHTYDITAAGRLAVAKAEHRGRAPTPPPAAEDAE